MKKRRLLILDTDGMGEETTIFEDQSESVLHIGRRTEGNEIHIVSPLVSRQHGMFTLEDDKVFYTDCDSRNGTILDTDGYRRLLKHTNKSVELKDGDILRVMDGEGSLSKGILILYEEDQEDRWRKYPLVGTVTKIGRDDTNDIIFSEPTISRFHIQIIRRGEKYFLVHGESQNGCFINGGSVEGEVELREKDLIRLMNITLIYSGGALYFKSNARGTNIALVDLTKEVGKHQKCILNHVSATIPSNDFVAIVGGSGAGKTTLMNVICSFDKKYSGHVYYNGIDLKEHAEELSSLIGYVPQDNIIYENLTLERMLYYTACLKMPVDMNRAEKEQLIDKVLTMVSLTDQKDTFIRKLSGGEKKRASIAVELLVNPNVFFLDEPTSGLDPGTGQQLMLTLKKLSDSQGKTIVMVTHDTENLSLCDKILFIGRGGRICFFGNQQEAMSFFQTDNLVDIYTMLDENSQFWEEQYLGCRADNLTEVESQPDQKAIKKRRKGSFLQLFPLFLRNMELLWNDQIRLAILLAQPILIGLLLLIVANTNSFYLYDDTKVILFALCCAAIWIGLFNTIQEICKERSILRREYMGNLSLPIYAGAKLLVQLFLGIVQALLLTAIFYFLVGHPEQGILFKTSFIELLLTVWLTIVSSAAMGLMVSALVTNADRAMAIAPFILIFQLLFSGVLFELQGAAALLSNLTVSKWAVGVLGSVAHLNELPISLQYLSAYREEEALFLSTSSQVLFCWAVLLGICLTCMILCTLFLASIVKDER